ncbi:probable phytol kinase 1, chloroplastic isoform X2 [Humulus lupulus]|uniref:probable phytol kinase 1, chloroplastic isoform X2 n=1 Tax=Humulus lupulus TaxID=3486 RepID=UPI002B410156|nr:probable phytol kinase 1, chloroplastic isoform X2 [Humulus lupulus]
MSLLTFTPLSIVRLPHPLRSSAGDFLHSSPFPGLLPPEPSPILRFQLLYRAPNVPRRISFAVSGCLPVSASSHLTQDAVATAAVLVGAYGLVFTFDSLTGRNLIQQNSTSTSARYFASLVPMVNCLRLLVHGFSLVNDDGLIKSVTRHGNPEELLRGPLYYVIVLILCALVFWRESPVGVISLSMMCGGDGVADIMGRKFGSVKIPYNPGKSWAGSISMFVFGFLVSVGMLYYFSALGYIQLDWSSTIQRVALVAMVATVVESLPISEAVDDNLSVPLATMIAAYLSFNL